MAFDPNFQKNKNQYSVFNKQSLGTKDFAALAFNSKNKLLDLFDFKKYGVDESLFDPTNKIWKSAGTFEQNVHNNMQWADLGGMYDPHKARQFELYQQAKQESSKLGIDILDTEIAKKNKDQNVFVDLMNQKQANDKQAQDFAAQYKKSAQAYMEMVSSQNKLAGNRQRFGTATSQKAQSAVAFKSKQSNTSIPLGGSSIFEGSEVGTAVDKLSGKKTLLGG